MRINCIIFLLIFFFIILQGNFYYFSNSNITKDKKDRNFIKFNNEFILDKSFNIFNLEDVLSEDPYENFMNDKWFDIMKNKFNKKNINLEPINNDK